MNTNKNYRRRLLRNRLVFASACLLLSSIIVGYSGGSIVRAQAPPSTQQKSYDTPEAAVDDLVVATRSKDGELLRRIFGPSLNDLMSGDPVQEATELEHFSSRLAEKKQLVRENDNRYILNLGQEEWPFPVPLVKESNRWIFNTKEGIEELLDRRIGENEIHTILTCRAYAQAQWEYFLEGDWDNDLVQEFAQKLGSAPGLKDGLYWPTATSEDPSPLGALVASARSAGYLKRERTTDSDSEPYYGYHYRILKAQGQYAPGGAYSYVINGNMIGGFALVAYPSVYGSSGVMTFIVNQQGRVYQKDLGERTATLAAAMTLYSPDASWKVAEESVGETPLPAKNVVTRQEWRVTEIDSAPVTSTGDRPLTLRVEPEPGRFNAFGGVNQISGSYTLEGDQLRFSGIISTRRAGSPEMMTQEAALVKCLAEIVSIKRADNLLILSDEAGRERLRLVRAEVR